jgi:hypothetical protein
LAHDVSKREKGKNEGKEARKENKQVNGPVVSGNTINNQGELINLIAAFILFFYPYYMHLGVH